MAETAVKVYYGNLMMLPDVSRVLACLNEKNVKFEIIDMTKKQHPVPIDFLKLQEKPSNRIHGPLIEEGTKFLTGSRTICRYFSEKYAKQGYEYLLGSDPLERASIEQWLKSEEKSFDPLSWTLAFHIAFAPLMNLEPERGLIQESERKLSEVLDVYNQRLAESKFLAGNKFTLADLAHLPNSHYLANSKEWSHLFTSRKHVQKWWKKISERESWRKTVMELDVFVPPKHVPTATVSTATVKASSKGIVFVPPKHDLSTKLVELPDNYNGKSPEHSQAHFENISEVTSKSESQSPTLQDKANQPFQSPIESTEKLSDNKEGPIASSILSPNTQQKLSQTYENQLETQDNKTSPPQPLQLSSKNNENEKTPPSVHLYTSQTETSLERSKLSNSEQTSPKGTLTSSETKEMAQPSFSPEITEHTQPFPRNPFGQSPNQQAQGDVPFKGEHETFEKTPISSKGTIISSDMEQTPRSASQLETPKQTLPSPKEPVGQSPSQQAQAETPPKEEESKPFESPHQRSEEVRKPAEKSRDKNDTSLLQSDHIPKTRQETVPYSRKSGDPTNIKRVSPEKPQMPEGNEDGSAPKSPKPLQESITRKEGEQSHEPFPSFTPRDKASQPTKPQTGSLQNSKHSYLEQDSTMGKLHTPSVAQDPVPTSQPELLEQTKPSSQMVKSFEQTQKPETQNEVQKPERKFTSKSDTSDSQPDPIYNTLQETSPSSRKSNDPADTKQMPQEPEEKKDAETVD